MKNQLALLRFGFSTLNGEQVDMEIFTNIKDNDILNSAILNWLVRTKEISEESFCNYINSKKKNTGHVASTIGMFRQFIKEEYGTETPLHYKTEKRFHVITCLSYDISKLGTPIDEVICDSCNEETIVGLYIAVLNRFFCQKCFDRWHETAKNHSSDIPIEQKNLNHVTKILEL